MAILEALCAPHAPGSTMRSPEALLRRNQAWASSNFWGLTSQALPATNLDLTTTTTTIIIALGETHSCMSLSAPSPSDDFACGRCLQFVYGAALCFLENTCFGSLLGGNDVLVVVMPLMMENCPNLLIVAENPCDFTDNSTTIATVITVAIYQYARRERE